MSIATPVDPPSSNTDRAGLAPESQALRLVLEWVRDVDESSPALEQIPGASDSELRQLARLSSLILGCIRRDAVPSELIDGLSCDPRVLPTPQVVSSFATLVQHNAVGNLAELYAFVVRQASRRALGTFFTPREAAQAMVRDYASRHPAPAAVIDVGAGVGIFSEIAREQWPSASLRAVDINPVTLGLQAVVAAARPEWRVRLDLADFRAWLEKHTPTGATLYLGNPPYTRWQLLPHDERLKLAAAADGLVGARANLSTLFLAMTLAKLAKHDSISMIIPAGWMQADYGRKLRSRLRELTRRQVRLRLADSWRFENAIVEAVVVEIGPQERSNARMSVSDWSGSVTHYVDRAAGQASLPMLDELGAQVRPSATRAKAGGRLIDFVSVRRGVATGAHEFFVQRDAQWIELGISRRYLRPLVRRLRSGETPDSPTVEQSALLVLDGYVQGADQRVDDWIAIGRELELDRRHLCVKRTQWFDLSAEVKFPDVVVAALGRTVFRIFENDNGFAITNNMFGLCWGPDVSVANRQGILDWLRSDAGQEALFASASVEANGLHRLSPKKVAHISIPQAVLQPGTTGGLQQHAPSRKGDRK